MPTPAEMLAAEAKLVEGFIACLNAEQEALKAGNVDELATVNARKSGLADQLNSLEDERNAFLTLAGLTGDRRGMLDWLARNRQDRAAAQAWARLTKLAAEARNLNNLNGQLIAIRLQATNQALAAITQQAQRTTLYGPNGQSTLRTGSRIIDAA